MIKKLDFNTLHKATVLRDEIFPELGKTDKATLHASLDKENYQSIYEDGDINLLDYWIYLDIQNDVVGIVGLYTQNSDTNDKVWLGWYGVKPSYRGKKIGSKLLDFATQKASEEGYKELHLYTTNDAVHQDAIALYLRRGFVKYKKDKELKTIYYKKELYVK